MSDYIVKHNVPIIDEHVLTDEDGNPLVHIDEQKLRAIADRNNARVRDTGDEVPTIIGHTVDGAPETKQPPLIDAWWSNFRVAPFFKTGRKCVTATLKFHKSLLKKMRQYPRRSVELWLGDYKIDPIALLGPTTPERDLGLLRLAADGRKIIRRVLPTKDHMDTNAIVQAVLKALEQTDVFAYCRQKMKEDQAAQEEMPGQDGMDGLDGQDGMEGTPPPPPEEGQDGQDGVGEEELEGKEPVRESASTASASNSFVPGTGRKPVRPTQGQPSRYSRLATEVNKLRVKLARAERRNDLLDLQANEGIELDVEEELEEVQGLSDEQYARYLGRVKKNYSRGGPIGTATDWNEVSRSPQAQTGRSEAIAIAEYAREKNLSYEAARSQLGYA